jgi:folate-binding protein YgfZ
VDAESRRAPDGYGDALERAAWREELPGLIRLSGGDAISFLHNVLTNDIQSLRPGQVRYTAYLTPQGRMISDADVIRRADDVLLAVESSVATELAQRLDQSLFSEDVRIEDWSTHWASLTVYGPEAARALAAAMGIDPPGLDVIGSDTHKELGDLVVAADDRLGMRALRVFGPHDARDRVAAGLNDAGVARLGEDGYTALRIEAGVPLFGVDMTTSSIPLEAGIEGRAISMTKGCYVGPEVIVRILHRGHGRVAKRLAGLLLDGPDVPPRESPLFAEGANVGAVTSSAWSPRLERPVAMGYVSRDAAVPGNSVYVGAPGGVAAQIAAFPLTDNRPG